MKTLLLAAVLLFLPIYPALADSQEHIPTNDDVLLMVKFHSSDSKILDAINSSTKTNFDTSADGVAKLASAGASSSVIAAMMKKQSAQSGTNTPASAPVPSSQSSPSTIATMGIPIHSDVSLHTKDGDTALEGRQGKIRSRNYYFVGVIFHTFPGATSKVRTSDRRPTIFVHVENNPSDKQESSISYLVKLEASKSDDERSLKFGKITAAHNKSDAPDVDSTLPYETTQDSPGVWRITPTADLAPGEYGLYSRGLVYDFGVD